MRTAWIRVSRTCQNACLFCSEKGELDGTVVPIEQIKAEIDAAADAGLERIVLSGGEPTLHKGLLAAIRHGKARGLTVSLTTNGRILQTEKHVEVLKGAGLDEIAVSVHSGRKGTHDTLVGRTGAWVESLQALRVAGRGGLRTILKTVITQGNDDDLHHLQHLGTMAGIAEMEVRQVRPVGAAADLDLRTQVELGARQSLTLLDRLWFLAKEEVVQLRAVGFEHTADLALEPVGAVQQADTAALLLLRQRAHLFSAGKGFSLLDADGMGKDVSALSELAGGLDAAGHELAARGAPILDAPPCLGGLAAKGEAAFAEAVFEEPACAACPERPTCGRLPRKLGKLAVGRLAPLPAWAPLAGRVAVVPGADAVVAQHAWPALVAALRAAGVEAELLSAEEAEGFPTAIAADAGAAQRLRGVGRRIVLDAGDDGLEGLGPADHVVSWLPGRVERLVGRVPLRQVQWRPWPVADALVAEAPTGEGVALVGLVSERALAHKALAGHNLRVIDVLGAADVEVLAAILGARTVLLLPGRAPGPAVLRWAALAAAAGRPIVAQRGPGLEDHVVADRSGLLVPPGLSVALGDAVVRATTEEALGLRLAAGARTLAHRALVSTWARELVAGGRVVTRAATSPERAYPAW